MEDIRFVPQLSKRTSVLRAQGVTPGVLRGASFDAPYRGLHRPAGVSLEQPGARIADAIGLMTPGCVLTGWASRWLQDQAFCDGEQYGDEMPVTVLCGPGSDLRARPGIRLSDRRYLPGEALDFDELAATTLARAAYDDMLDAPSPTEALVVLEMATSTTIEQPRTALDNVRAVFDAHVKTRGRKQTRWALSQASTRSASPWETRTRMLAIDATGVEHWLVNVPVFDRRGHLLGIADLLDSGTGLAVESDGADHRRIERHNADNVRENSFEAHGMPVVRVGSAQHSRAQRSQTIQRIADGRARARSGGSGLWTTEKPSWWWDWPPGRRWD